MNHVRSDSLNECLMNIQLVDYYLYSVGEQVPPSKPSKEKLMAHFTMKREIAFTAGGFFKLDYTLVHSMVASATTYLVLLIQFGKLPEEPVPSSTLPMWSTTSNWS
ncbi:unnamed protein product [Nezara viridula]|uniref:Gustatory receptor n=1 Tax=Nezara viridula TaxID=85310 RepID=A0A9P0EDS4_NEZVI|nr:unnamed protein product [Nezara viridula]